MTTENGTGLAVSVVTPGGADDPFTRGNVDPQTNVTTQTSANPVTQPQVVTQQVTQATAPTAMTQAQIDALVSERVGKATSTLDRRVNALTQQLEQQATAAETARVANLQAVREASVKGLREDQVQEMKKVWESEDRMALLETREKAVVDLYRSTEGLRLLQSYSEFGVTEEDILGYTGDPTALEDFVKGLAFDKVREGGGTVAQAKAAVVQGQSNMQQQDIGSGGAGNTGGPQMLTTAGMNSLAANVKTLFNDPSGRPW